jgi:hypothetical protein
MVSVTLSLLRTRFGQMLKHFYVRENSQTEDHESVIGRHMVTIENNHRLAE